MWCACIKSENLAYFLKRVVTLSNTDPFVYFLLGVRVSFSSDLIWTRIHWKVKAWSLFSAWFFKIIRRLKKITLPSPFSTFFNQMNNCINYPSWLRFLWTSFDDQTLLESSWLVFFFIDVTLSVMVILLNMSCTLGCFIHWIIYSI